MSEMRIPRIYSPQSLSENSTIQLEGQAASHLARVLRMGEGDQLILFNGEGGEYLAEIVGGSKSRLELQVLEYRENDLESPLAITLLQGVSKGERMDLVMQKSVELGVSRIVPVMMERSVVNLKGDRKEKRREHWQKVVVSACEQSGRNRVPEVLPVCTLDQWLAKETPELGVILNPLAETGLKGLAKPSSMSITVLIGPEGGLSEREVTQAEQARFCSVQLGPRILRTETAALTIVGLLQAQWGDL